MDSVPLACEVEGVINDVDLVPLACKYEGVLGMKELSPFGLQI